MPIIKHLDQQSFTEALFNPEQQGQIAIIYFSASWCQPCKNMQPIFEQLLYIWIAQPLILASLTSLNHLL